jgi:hypothetical protein
VGKLIDYPKALAGYKFLTTTPQQMKQLIEEKRGTVQLIVSEVESRQATVASALGLPRAQAEGAQLRIEQDEAALATEKSRDAEGDAKRRLAAIDNDRGEYYQEAIAAFQNLLQRTERSLMAARAAQTPELNDDQVVARLRHIEGELSERQKSLGQRARTTEVAGQRAAALAELAARFRRSQYDHPRSLFADEFDVDGQLWAIVEGTTDLERVWQHIRRYQSLGPSLAEQTANALQHPMTQILLQTMAHTVGSALGEYASRAGQQHRRHRNDQRDWF